MDDPTLPREAAEVLGRFDKNLNRKVTAIKGKLAEVVEQHYGKGEPVDVGIQITPFETS